MLSFLEKEKLGFLYSFAKYPRCLYLMPKCSVDLYLCYLWQMWSNKDWMFWIYKLICLSYWWILSVTLSTRLGDGVYDTFMMIDETKCPPCSNVLCNPSELPLPRRLNVSKWSSSLLSSCLGKKEVLLNAQGTVTTSRWQPRLFCFLLVSLDFEITVAVVQV